LEPPLCKSINQKLKLIYYYQKIKTDCTQNFLPIFFGVIVILKVAISLQLQIGVNQFLVEPPTVHEVIQHGCLQRLQPEVKEED